MALVSSYCPFGQCAACKPPAAMKRSGSFFEFAGIQDQFQLKTGAVVFSEDVTVPSTVSADFIDDRLAGTPMAGLGRKLSKSREKDHGVNAIFS